MTKALGYAAKHSFSRLKPLEFERPAPKANEVQIDVLYCGVCHSDIHQVENDWGNTVYVIDMASLKREMDEAA